MIPGIFNTLQKDFDTLLNVDPTKATSQLEKQKLQALVGFASMRVFGAACMGLGALITFSAVPAFLLTGAISKLLLGVVTYVVGHDIFKLGMNKEAHVNSLAAQFLGIGHFSVGGEIACRQYHINKLTDGLLLQFILAPVLLKYANKEIDRILGNPFEAIRS